MKNHSEVVAAFNDWFVSARPNPLSNADVCQKVNDLTRGGVAPEGMGSISVNAIVDSIYKLNSPVYQPKPSPELVAPAPKFHLGGKSQGKLAFLMQPLVLVVTRAIELTTVDFTVSQTIRSLEEQKVAVATGHSRTMQSLHLKQSDGFAHAVDLAAWVNGEISWVDDYYADIALAMDKAATEQGVAHNIRWGGAWDRRLSDFGGDHAAYLKEIQDYRARHPGSDLIDQPHYEWQA